ncbi:MAG: translation initiation factor IF-2 [Candidatus Pacebacteria bacterium]|nr:translation initiation factor IF-2 [Candidatus Paceibacterota bacterium]MCF7862938.1 translation initiation factor IF-2 [Candidatus Paceibacterota bacterium]
MNKNKNENNIIERSPVVVIMGHIDHGKSTLLDYIRNTNIVEKEAGGITQALSAYEVLHKDEEGIDRKITFIDTPGHESFSKMRERGAMTADIAILIVSAEDGVKPQTLEAKKTIDENNIPYIVAINKIDKPNANIEKTKIELAENEIYLENFGGKIPVAEISAKTGDGVDNLLSLINIMAMMEDFKGDKNQNASGFVLEANLDSKRGIEATLVIKNGLLTKGMFVTVKDSMCSTNIMENFLGKPIKEISFSSPVRLVGWNKMPEIGNEFQSFDNKKEAEKYISEQKKIFENKPHEEVPENPTEDKKIIPIVLKADTWGSVEAIEKEISKIQSENAEFKIVQKGIGPICEFDVKTISSPENILVVCFNVKIDKSAVDICLQKNIQTYSFDIIYKLTEWLTEEMENRKPKVRTLEITGRAKILKVFSKMKDKQIAGGKVLEGRIIMAGENRIMRRETEIGKGNITNLEKNKTKTKEVEEGTEFGMMIESKTEIAPGDIIESFYITEK